MKVIQLHEIVIFCLTRKINYIMDSNWTRDLDFFLELPKGKCIFASDGTTDIYKIKEKLGDHMCVMGDVPAPLLGRVQLNNLGK